MSLGDLARELKVDKSTVARWEAGRQPRDKLLKLATALDTTVEALLG